MVSVRLRRPVEIVLLEIMISGEILFKKKITHFKCKIINILLSLRQDLLKATRSNHSGNFPMTIQASSEDFCNQFVEAESSFVHLRCSSFFTSSLPKII